MSSNDRTYYNDKNISNDKTYYNENEAVLLIKTIQVQAIRILFTTLK